jgi:hypothetical protein
VYKGDKGESAYEVWLSLGNTGTEQDFLDSLSGVTVHNLTTGRNAPDAHPIGAITGLEELVGKFSDYDTLVAALTAEGFM